MKGDFSRNTFDRTNHFARVLMQQGRVQIDADFNEQTSILLHYLQTVAADLIGPYGGPGDGFRIIGGGNTGDIAVLQTADGKSLSIKQNDFAIIPGHYYVNGKLCENETHSFYTAQPDYSPPGTERLSNSVRYLVYLDVWERHITHLQSPEIREVALAGPDTATRAKLVWQVKVKSVKAVLDALRDIASTTGEGEELPASEEDMNCTHIHRWWPVITANVGRGKNRGQLKARAKINSAINITEACIIPPESRYRGAENQLYRVEIHRGGTVSLGDEGNGSSEEVTFKWSRDNGSVVFPIKKFSGQTIKLEHLGRDDRFTLQEGDWVEIIGESQVLNGEREPLGQIKAVDRSRNEVTLKTAPSATNTSDNLLLRRWDQQANKTETGGPQINEQGVEIIPSTEQEERWIVLEDGVEVMFAAGTYYVGDYWLIPARTATGDVEWPQDQDERRMFLGPQGVDHYYAPLAIIEVDGNGLVNRVEQGDCRCIIRTGSACSPPEEPQTNSSVIKPTAPVAG